MKHVGVSSAAKDVATQDQLGVLLETAQLIGAMTVKPYSGRIALIDWTLLQLKTTGLWAKLDGIWFFAAHDAQAARLNWRNPSSFAFTEVNSITFTEDAGYTGDGAGMSLSSAYIPGVSGTQYTQNNAHMGIVVMTGSAATGYDVGAGSPTVARLRVRTGTDIFNINDATNVTYSGADVLPSHSVINRRDATNGAYFINGVSVAAFTTTSTALPGSGLTVGRAGASSYSDRRWACVHVGASLTDAENAVIAQIVGEYLFRSGSIVIILSYTQAQEVAGISVAEHALEPVALKNGSFALPEAVLADRQHSDHHALLLSLPRRVVLRSEIATGE